MKNCYNVIAIKQEFCGKFDTHRYCDRQTPSSGLRGYRKQVTARHAVLLRTVLERPTDTQSHESLEIFVLAIDNKLDSISCLNWVHHLYLSLGIAK